MTTRRKFLRIGLFVSTILFLTGIRSEAKNSLWKVTAGDHILYLQGSVHCLKAENYPLDPAIEKAFADSRVLVLEIDMKEMQSPQAQQLMLSKATLPEGQLLHEVLNAETWELVKTACDETGLPTARIEQLKPWFFAMTLSMAKMQALGFKPRYGLDNYFYDKAAGTGKQVVGLETVAFQINLFDLLSAEDQQSIVRQTIEDLKILESEMAVISKAWAQGDADQIEETMLKSFKEFPHLYEKLITDRNISWMKQIDSFLKQPETHMVVVGAAHLPGKDGLLDLLKQKGYSVEQL